MQIKNDSGLTYYNNLTTAQKARWMSLLLAIDQIETHCSKNNLNFDEEVLKPIPIKHFIEEKTPQIEDFLIKDIQKQKMKTMVYNLINDLKNVEKA